MDNNDKPKTLHLAERIVRAFGAAVLLQDGRPVWKEKPDTEYKDCLTVKQAEDMASLYPESDWQIHFIGPLSEFYYKRQDKELWVLYKTCPGFRR